MSGLRLVMLSSRYWPLVGEAERFFTALALEFQQQGASPTILTARWGNNWPAQVTHRGLPVVRLPSAPRGGWSTFRYLRDVSRWLRANATSYDLVYVGSLRHEAYAAIVALNRRRCVIVLRPEAIGPEGDCSWQSRSRIGKRIRHGCRTADAVVAPSESSERELLAADYPPDRIRLITHGAELPVDRTAETRHQARLALAEANHDLAVAEYAPVVVCVERLETNRGLEALIAAWQIVVERWPSAKLWIVGDGTDRIRLYGSIVDRQLHHQILLPGSFDELAEIFQAADVYVSAAGAAECAGTSLAAMAAGLPVITIATRDNRVMMDAGVHGLLMPAGTSDELSAAICQLLENPALGYQLGKAARRRVAERYSLSQIASEHLLLFGRLAGGC